MLCENCNKNVATVHLIEIVNQDKKEMNLCENCAQETGLPFSKPSLTVNDLFGLVDAGITKSGGAREANVRCEECGMTLREFRTKGRFGCANDYEAFRDHLHGLLEKIHGSTLHKGKGPGVVPAQNAKKGELEILRQRLNQAVTKEEYEEAAKLRDQINEIEKDLKFSSESSS